MEDLQEVRALLAERVVEWTHPWREEGLEAGRRVGRQEGQAAVLIRFLERKFGPLEEAQRQRIREAHAPTLLEWEDRVFSADRLEDVFQE